MVVLRDASQLTGSVTVDVGGSAAQARSIRPCMTAPSSRCTARSCGCASTGDNVVDWLVGGFYQHVDRHYRQDLPTPGYDALLA